MTIEVSILVLPGLLALAFIIFAVGYFMGERHGVRMTLKLTKPRMDQLQQDLTAQQDENDQLYDVASLLARKLDRERWSDPEVQAAMNVLSRHRLWGTKRLPIKPPEPGHVVVGTKEQP